MSNGGSDVSVTLVWKMLVLVAVLLMPLGAQSVAAVPGSHQHAAAPTMPMEHCPDQGRRHDMNGGFAQCAMACSAALPAADLSRPEPLNTACDLDVASVAEHLHGLHPDTATPPPKYS